ncbi:MAG: hypothetical protein HZA78_11435 [Candidatus Schekmanbacteria bacterium]|nr:hypothetical protein [Candidatus Schekmanbacteria bacterium]
MEHTRNIQESKNPRIPLCVPLLCGRCPHHRQDACATGTGCARFYLVAQASCLCLFLVAQASCLCLG